MPKTGILNFIKNEIVLHLRHCAFFYIDHHSPSFNANLINNANFEITKRFGNKKLTFSDFGKIITKISFEFD